MLLLKLLRDDIGQRRRQALPLVDFLYKPAVLRPRVFQIAVLPPVHPFLFERANEALAPGIVLRIAAPTDADADVVLV